jgi:hypothetical protein
MAAIRPHSGLALGAAASHSFKDPHSSASTWEKAIHRIFSGGMTCRTASWVTGKSRRGPV